jgi:membrane-bound inhibitor of C-type lysozyme
MLTHLAVAALAKGRGQAVAVALAQHQGGRPLRWNTNVLLVRFHGVGQSITLVAVVSGTRGAKYGGGLVALVTIFATSRTFAHQFDDTQWRCSCSHLTLRTMKHVPVSLERYIQKK